MQKKGEVVLTTPDQPNIKSLLVDVSVNSSESLQGLYDKFHQIVELASEIKDHIASTKSGLEADLDALTDKETEFDLIIEIAETVTKSLDGILIERTGR